MKLIDDFPRQLTDLELSKLFNSLEETLRLYPKSDPLRIDREAGPLKVLPDNVNAVLNKLPDWSPQQSIFALNELVSSGLRPGDLSQLQKDPRFQRFVTDLSFELPVNELVQLLELFQRTAADNGRINRLLEEILLKRNLSDLSTLELSTLAEVVARYPPPDPQVVSRLVDHALSHSHLPVLLSLIPHGLHQGKLLIPLTLIPVLNKSELIRVLRSLQDCAFPHLIASTVSLVSDELSRLSFHRLVTDEEKDSLLLILFRLKTALDKMAFVDGNPFYTKGNRGEFLRKILANISGEFHAAATALPMPDVGVKIMALSGLNQLRLESVDLVANRIASFGHKLLHPNALSGTEFTCVVWAILNHPQAWKRTDRYRNAIAVPLAKALEQHADTLQPHQVLACSKSLMQIHNKRVRLAVFDVLTKSAPALIAEGRNVDLLLAAKLYCQLLKSNEMRSAPIEPVIAFIRAVNIPTLTTPQLVELLSVHAMGRVVGRAEELVHALDARVNHPTLGGLISPTNVARVMEALALLQVRQVPTTLVSAMLESIEDPAEVHPRLAARILSGIAGLGIANPEIHSLTAPHVQDLLISISDPTRFADILSSQSVARELALALPLLGNVGQAYTAHLTALPVDSDAASDTSLISQPTGTGELSLYASLLETVGKGRIPRISRDVGESIVLSATDSFVGDLLGALVPGGNVSDENQESGGFRLESPLVWRHDEARIEVQIIGPKCCARDKPRHILGPMASQIVSQRKHGWRYIHLPADAIEAVAGSDNLSNVKRRIRRALILHKDGEAYDVLRARLKEVLSGNSN